VFVVYGTGWLRSLSLPAGELDFDDPTIKADVVENKRFLYELSFHLIFL
jgi:hypothetical protein